MILDEKTKGQIKELASRHYNTGEIARLLKREGISLPRSQIAYWAKPEYSRRKWRKYMKESNARKKIRNSKQV